MEAIRKSISTQRADTDVSLDVEREVADAVADEAVARARRLADDLVEHERLVVDERLRRFRDSADALLVRSRVATIAPSDLVSQERALADEATVDRPSGQGARPLAHPRVARGGGERRGRESARRRSRPCDDGGERDDHRPGPSLSDKDPSRGTERTTGVGRRAIPRSSATVRGPRTRSGVRGHDHDARDRHCHERPRRANVPGARRNRRRHWTGRCVHHRPKSRSSTERERRSLGPAAVSSAQRQRCSRGTSPSTCST